MKHITLLLALAFFSLPALAEDLGWRHLDFKSKETTNFSIDIKLNRYQYSLGVLYNSDIWIHVSDYMITDAKVVVLNYPEGSPIPDEVKEFDLVHNEMSHQFEAPVPYGLGSNGHLKVSSRQELAIRINNGHWLKVPGTEDTSNFSFNIFKEFNIK